MVLVTINISLMMLPSLLKNHFKFGQAYVNWLTLVETVSDPVVELGWHVHHKCMTVDREFLIWAQAWHVHDQMLRMKIMVKPFVLDPSSAAYEKQFKKCKLNQALLGGQPSSRDLSTQTSLPNSTSESHASPDP